MLRILTFVLLVIAGFYMMFSWAVPEYQALDENKKKLDETKKAFENVQKRVESYNSIKQAIDTQKSKVLDIMNTIPQTEEEDKILHALSLAKEKSELLVNDFQIGEELAIESDAQQPATQDAPSLGSVIGQDGTPEVMVTPNELRKKYVKVTVLGVGTYASVKSFIQSIQGIERNFEVAFISVDKKKDESATQENSDALKDVVEVDMTLRFGFAQKSLAKSDTILESFETKTLDPIQTFKREQVVFPDGGLRDLEYQKSRENPFLSVQ